MIMDNECLKNKSVEYMRCHICLKSDILFQVTNWFYIVTPKPKQMPNRRILIGLTFLEPFITIGDKKNVLGEAGASSHTCG